MQHACERKYMHKKVLVGNLKGGDHQEDIDVAERKIFEHILV
jgi:hypothetical protein